MRPLITLMTDFGLSDPFVGVMKGVILSIVPNAEIIDLTHEIEPQNIIQAALVLKSSHSYFPPKTVHLVVVDPEVGSARRPLAVQSVGYHFIGPDNGVLTPVLNSSAKIYKLNDERFFLNTISSTFHGRDVFAPVAAWVGKGIAIPKIGRKIRDPIKLDLAEPSIHNKVLRGQIVYIDHFGNLISNISSEVLKSFSGGEYDNITVRLGARKITSLAAYYSQCKKGTFGAILNSWNVLEVFCHGGNAAKKLKRTVGDPITVSFNRSSL